MKRKIVPDSIVPYSQRVHNALNEDIIADHLDKFLVCDDNEKKCFVYSSMLEGPHVYCYAPSLKLNRDFWTLVSMGLSGTEMIVPEDIENREKFSHAEVFCYLPEDWHFPSFLGSDEMTEENWPMEMLRSLANYVSSTKCWIAEDHGLPNLYSNPPGQPFHASTKLSHMILLYPVNEVEDFSVVYVNGTQVNFYLVCPLTSAEAQWKRDVGAENSIYFIVGSKKIGGDNVLVDYVIDAKRPCCVDDLNAPDMIDNEDESEAESDNSKSSD